VKKISAAVVAVLLLISGAKAKDSEPFVIYGEDGRSDLFQVNQPRVLAAANSTVAIIPIERLTWLGNRVNIKSEPFGSDQFLCQDESFFGQPSPANCSGFLVGPDLIATAGHCVDWYNCSGQAVVFNYKMQSSQTGPAAVLARDVYVCKEIISLQTERGKDYSLFRLDRAVQGRKPLELSKGPVHVRDEIMAIGHPAGLPTKVISGGRIRKVEQNFFIASLDSYNGSSGSAVFNSKNMKVIGILARGEQDFEFDSNKSCLVSKRCLESHCRGEDVTNIESVIQAMNLPPMSPPPPSEDQIPWIGDPLPIFDPNRP